ncbi:MAG: nickel pincer cofactor biosynthesis protein LarB [Methylacidiphilales bacterium]|nr:nickel pincer cofactor biosynthesis protein LarB [Candidatus Methylacidiphilales bacterium]
MSKNKQQPELADLQFAQVDLDRQKRCGAAEVILGMGKTPAQIRAIATVLKKAGQPVLITRTNRLAYQAVRTVLKGSVFHEQASIIAHRPAKPDSRRRICVCAAGTGDLPVAEEAAVTAGFFGNHVERCYDVGVAGLHRLVRRLDLLRSSLVIIAVAGMEGALPSVIAGLVDRPVIAVPTSVGYGANLRGITALLGMLTSCGSGVTVVNIDNGFGAAYAANQILRLVTAESRQPKAGPL